MITNEKLKLLTNIREKITAYFPTDDNRLDDDFIWEQCKIIRTIFIEKLFAEGKRNVEDFFSRITLDILAYNATTEPDLPSLKRVIMPNLINLEGNIRYVGPSDRTQEYVRTTFDGFFHLQGRDFTTDKIYYLPFHDRLFFSSAPIDENDVEYTTIDIWCLLENPEDDTNWDEEIHPLVPKKYQLMLEDMVADNILKYANNGVLSRLNDGMDLDTRKGEKVS